METQLKVKKVRLARGSGSMSTQTNAKNQGENPLILVVGTFP